jgi:hypothetical protein
VGGSGGDTSDAPSAALHTLRSEHTQRLALAQHPPPQACSCCNMTAAAALLASSCLTACLAAHNVGSRLSLSCVMQGNELEVAALKEGEYVAVRRFVRLLERGGDAKVRGL